MKKIQKLLGLFLAITLLCSLTACGKHKENTMPKKYQEIIDDHIDGQDETNYLLVGDEDRPQATFHMDSFLPIYKAGRYVQPNSQQ